MREALNLFLKTFQDLVLALILRWAIPYYSGINKNSKRWLAYNSKVKLDSDTWVDRSLMLNVSSSHRDSTGLNDKSRQG